MESSIWEVRKKSFVGTNSKSYGPYSSLIPSCEDYDKYSCGGTEYG